MLAGVVSMPSNIFAATGTNVSILFIDRENREDVVLVDASGLGTKVKLGDKNQKTVLSREEEDQIIDTFNKKEAVDDFSVIVSYDEIESKNYSLSAGQYFEVKIEYADISSDEFDQRLLEYKSELNSLFNQSEEIEESLLEGLAKLNFNE
jgi:type I restriction enzyme M protein